MSQPARTVCAYLNFEGRCEEALKFYESALGITVEALMRFKDAPPAPQGEPGQDSCVPGDPEKIMHCAFRVGSSMVMASDCRCSGQPAFAGVSLALEVPDTGDAARCFQGLSEGGTVCMPLEKTFWSPAFGVVTDKFGVCWMISTAPASQP